MAPKLPEIARYGDGWSDLHVERILFIGLRIRLLENQVDFRNFEASDGHIEIIEGQQMLKFDRQNRLIPAGFFGQTVVGNDVGADLVWRQENTEVSLTGKRESSPLGCPSDTRHSRVHQVRGEP